MNPETLEISVILCTHNPRRDYLTRVLESLQGQTLAPSRWELILVDNASKVKLSDEFDLSWQSNARHVLEPKLGLTHARLRGARESIGECCLLVDDDNVLDADYLETGMSLMNTYPKLGAWGGQCVPEYEVEPPDWLFVYQHLLAINVFEGNTPAATANDPNPVGAGMFVKRKYLDRYYESTSKSSIRQSLDRSGNDLTSGGDKDILNEVRTWGGDVGLFEALKLTHLIDKGRLTEDYMVRLIEGVTYSSLIMHFSSESIVVEHNVAYRLLRWLRRRAKVFFLSSRERKFITASHIAHDRAELFSRTHLVG